MVAVMVMSCGGSTATSPATTPATPVAADPPAVVAEPVPPPPPPPPPPTATFEGVITAGALGVAEATELLSPHGPAIAACLGSAGPTTTELLFSIPDGVHLELRNAWHAGVAIAPDCLKPMFAADPNTRRGTRSTGVYVVVKATPPGTTAPAAPAPPESRAEHERMFCHLERLSGADKSPVENDQTLMTTWVRDHVRHPAPYELAGQIAEQNPAEMDRFVTRSLKAVGIKKCPDRRW